MQASASRARSTGAPSRSPSRSRRRTPTSDTSRSATTSRSSPRCAPFFAPASVAVIGASSRREAIGGIVFRNVLAAEFKGAAYPVNRTGEPVAGVRAYTSIEELPEQVDLAVICLPGAHVLDAAGPRSQPGVRALCVISAGFAEIGEEGRERQEQLLALVRAHGGRLVGPNCLGIAVAGAVAQRDVRAARAPAGVDRRSRRRAARSVSRCSRRRRSAASASPRSSRSATRRTSPRTTCSSTGRRTPSTGADRALPRVVRQPAPVRRRSRAASPGRSRSSP